MCIAHVSEVKAPGDFLALELLGEPLLVVRDRAGVVRVLSRVCAHRAMDIMPEGFSFPRTGKASVLLCPYHHWTYNLDGSVRGCAQMQEAECFDKKDWRLKEFRSEIWKGFVFVNLDGSAPPLAEHYRRLRRRNRRMALRGHGRRDRDGLGVRVQLEGDDRELDGIVPSPRRASPNVEPADAGAEHLDRCRASAFHPQPPSLHARAGRARACGRGTRRETAGVRAARGPDVLRQDRVGPLSRLSLLHVSRP